MSLMCETWRDLFRTVPPPWVGGEIHCLPQVLAANAVITSYLSDFLFFFVAACAVARLRLPLRYGWPSLELQLSILRNLSRCCFSDLDWVGLVSQCLCCHLAAVPVVPVEDIGKLFHLGLYRALIIKNPHGVSSLPRSLVADVVGIRKAVSGEVGLFYGCSELGQRQVVRDSEIRDLQGTLRGAGTLLGMVDIMCYMLCT